MMMSDFEDDMSPQLRSETPTNKTAGSPGTTGLPPDLMMFGFLPPDQPTPSSLDKFRLADRGTNAFFTKPRQKETKVLSKYENDNRERQEKNKDQEEPVTLLSLLRAF